jgi:hypothetical protein
MSESKLNYYLNTYDYGDPTLAALFKEQASFEDIVNFMDAHDIQIDDFDEVLYYTPIHYAAHWGRQDVMQYLLDKGDDINSCTGDCETPLRLAMENNRDSAFIDWIASLGGVRVVPVSEDNWTPTCTLEEAATRYWTNELNRKSFVKEVFGCE